VSVKFQKEQKYYKIQTKYYIFLNTLYVLSFDIFFNLSEVILYYI